jgi:tetratricopeptide (TPR) repeat protein
MKSATFFVPLLLLSFSIPAAPQSTPRNDAVVSVQDLAMPSQAVRAFTKGTNLLLKGDPAASVAQFLKAIELAPASFRPYHNLGLAYFRLGQLDAASTNFQKSIDLSHGGFAPSLFGLSMIHYQRADYLHSKALIDRGLTADPGSAVGRYCLALVLFSIGRFAESERNALEALSLGPEFDAYVLLARIHERANNPTAVLADVESYLKLAPTGSLRPDALALLHSAQLQLTQAHSNSLR